MENDKAKDDFDKWLNMWDSSQEMFAKESPINPTPQYAPEDFFGNYNANPELLQEGVRPVKEPDAAYWKKIYEASQYLTSPVSKVEKAKEAGTIKKEDQEKLKTKKKISNKDEYGERAKILGNTSNPVEYPSYGKDQGDRKVTPNWTDGQELIELHNLKISLHELQSKFNTAMANSDDAKMKSVQSKIDELSEKIDELSNSLSPDFISDYLS